MFKKIYTYTVNYSNLDDINYYDVHNVYSKKPDFGVCWAARNYAKKDDNRYRER